MLRGEFPAAGELSPTELRREYESTLASVIETVGIDRVVEETGLDTGTVEALVDGESPTLQLTDAAAILALDDSRPPADAVAAEARDILLLGMTTAVLDVEALASGIDGQLEPKEIQQKIEGRHPMTIEEYALVHQFIEQRKS